MKISRRQSAVQGDRQLRAGEYRSVQVCDGMGLRRGVTGDRSHLSRRRQVGKTSGRIALAEAMGGKSGGSSTGHGDWRIGRMVVAVVVVNSGSIGSVVVWFVCGGVGGECSK